MRDAHPLSRGHATRLISASLGWRYEAGMPAKKSDQKVSLRRKMKEDLPNLVLPA